jgi:hypothetical protein
MKKFLLIIFFLITSITLQAQKDTSNVIGALRQKNISAETANINISIYPVPVRGNSFTVKTDRDITYLRLTNIIGQDIFRIKYNSPEQLVKVDLENPKRGMYLVTIIFSDGNRVVKKIMIEESE